jgi:hypothetical protein
MQKKCRLMPFQTNLKGKTKRDKKAKSPVKQGFY